MSVIIRDISTLGCKLEGAEGLSIGQNCELYFEWHGTHVGVEGQVAWEDAERQIGLKFLKTDKDTQMRLKEICAGLALEPLSAPRPKEAEAARSVPSSVKSPRATRSADSPEAAMSAPLRVVSEGKRRHLPRYLSELPCRVRCPATGSTLNAKLVNVSLSGGCLEGAGLPEVGQTCELQAEWEDKQLVAAGDVIWKVKQQVGVKFSPLDEEMEKLLRRICANLRLVPPAPLTF